MKLWGGRFKESESRLMESFNSSLSFDKTLYKEDILGSIAHAKMLTKCGILKEYEGSLIVNALEEILLEIEEGKLKIEGDFEDIHSFIEYNLIKKIGDTGKKLHTARSRNDQVALDMKLYAREKSSLVMEKLYNLNISLESLGEKYKDAIMPGYTHLQRAQVITFKYHLLCYVNMFKRDIKRIENAKDLLNESPLGCCALAGTTYNIDREYTAKELGFKKSVDNFLDGVSDRDYLIELMCCFSIIMMHLSRLCEEIILWSSKEFSFIEIGDEFSTGSSIMPQKKNPDAAELIRGKTGRVYGDLISLLTTMKSLPLSYNKDMQEDKEAFFDALDTTLSCVNVMTEMLKTIKVKEKNMKDAVRKGFLNATEVADYLVLKGVPFRDAHGIVGKIVLYCEEKDIAIEDLLLDELQKFSPYFNDDIYEYIDYNKSLDRGIKKEMK